MLTSEQTTPLEKREKAFSQLIRSGAFDNNPDLLKIAEQAKLWVVNKNVKYIYLYYLFKILFIAHFSFTVCREICSERGEFLQVFKYYILDNSKKHQIFSFISSKPEYFEQLSCDNFKVTTS